MSHGERNNAALIPTVYQTIEQLLKNIETVALQLFALTSKYFWRHYDIKLSNMNQVQTTSRPWPLLSIPALPRSAHTHTLTCATPAPHCSCLYLHAVVHPALLYRDKMFGRSLRLQSFCLHLLKASPQRSDVRTAAPSDRNGRWFYFVAPTDRPNQNRNLYRAAPPLLPLSVAENHLDGVKAVRRRRFQKWGATEGSRRLEVYESATDFDAFESEINSSSVAYWKDILFFKS